MATPSPKRRFSGSRPGAADAAGGVAVENLAEAAGLLEPELVHVVIDGIGGETVEQEIGGGVVADHDHEVHEIADGKTVPFGEFGEDAGAGDLIGIAQGGFVGPAGTA